MSHVLAVDGNSLAHRAFHALADEPRIEGWLTGGVVKLLASIWNEGPFDAVVVAFDGRDNRRKLVDPEYKAHRRDKDPALIAGLSALPAHLAACGLAVVRQPEVEADDLLAATADRCRERGWACSLLSSDRDLVALVSSDVRLLRPRRSMSDLRVYDPAAVEEEFGVRPDQYTDLAALRGDPSDGLDGCKGVGPKTAARLLRDHGDIPGIYAALSNLPPRLEAMLRAGRANVERNLLLMAPIPHLEVDVESAVAVGIDVTRAVRTLGELGLDEAATAFRWALERPPLPPLPPPPTDPPAELEPPPTIITVYAVPAPARAGLGPAAEGEQVTLF